MNTLPVMVYDDGKRTFNFPGCGTLLDILIYRFIPLSSCFGTSLSFLISKAFTIGGQRK